MLCVERHASESTRSVILSKSCTSVKVAAPQCRNTLTSESHVFNLELNQSKNTLASKNIFSKVLKKRCITVFTDYILYY